MDEQPKSSEEPSQTSEMPDPSSSHLSLGTGSKKRKAEPSSAKKVRSAKRPKAKGPKSARSTAEGNRYTEGHGLVPDIKAEVKEEPRDVVGVSKISVCNMSENLSSYLFQSSVHTIKLSIISLLISGRSYFVVNII